MKAIATMLWLAQPSILLKPLPSFKLIIVVTYARFVHLSIWDHQLKALGIG
jgi:hypothetical protein